MSIKKHIIASAMALSLLGGAGIVTAAPAQAATLKTASYYGYTTKARCGTENSSAKVRLMSTGRSIYSYTDCFYKSSVRKWEFKLYYY